MKWILWIVIIILIGLLLFQEPKVITNSSEVQKYKDCIKISNANLEYLTKELNKIIEQRDSLYEVRQQVIIKYKTKYEKVNAEYITPVELDSIIRAEAGINK